ncbi:MAG TPA: hypothetical protein VHO48_03015 [Anaerolineaceae bacterium]|nr:hypothetical protein [Anaerolineaceae bacterium]
MEPQVFILHGDDGFSMAREVDSWVEALGDATMADLNTTRLDGRALNDKELRNAADAMPFLTSYRLVILSAPLARLTAESARVRFVAVLDHLSPTTHLVLAIDDRKGRKGDWEVLKSGHWLLQWAAKNPEKAQVTTFSLPDAREMPAWIIKEGDRQMQALEAEKRVKFNARFSLPAANELFKHVGCDTQVAAEEISKLLTYANYRRTVERDDVLELVAQTGQGDVFGLVDALGTRKAPRRCASSPCCSRNKTRFRCWE